MLVSMSGWHKGISELVFFAAMMPAMRAVAKTSPLGILPPVMAASVSGCMKMRASAEAMRRVSLFADTSTMCASPFSFRWVSPSTAMLASYLAHHAGSAHTMMMAFGFMG